MADFVEVSNTKAATRTLTTPIANIAAFDALIESVLTDNPLACMDYIQGGVTYPGIARSRETYTVRVNYEDGEGARLGTVTARCPSVTSFTTSGATIMADADLATAMGGTAVRDSANETYSCTVRCHDANGELYTLPSAGTAFDSPRMRMRPSAPR